MSRGSSNRTQFSEKNKELLKALLCGASCFSASSVEYMTREEHVAFILGPGPKVGWKSWLRSVSQTTDRASKDANFLMFHRLLKETWNKGDRTCVDWVPLFLLFLLKAFVVTHTAWLNKEKTSKVKNIKTWSCTRGLFNAMCCAIVVASDLFSLVAATQSWVEMSVGTDSLKSQKVLHLSHKSCCVTTIHFSEK